MLMVSRGIGSRPLGVIFTARRDVFICGEMAVIVPWRMVPKEYVREDSTLEYTASVPFLSSMVTVSFAHFIKNLSKPRVSVAVSRRPFARMFQRMPTDRGMKAYLTSFILTRLSV